jgi:tetraacyldisaccharide 4'-kinase
MWQMTRWLWSSRTPAARLARISLLPTTALYWAVMVARARSYRMSLLRRRRPPLPTVAVGNLTVGGSGKTPIASWIAQYYATRGRSAAILLRGYGGDEAYVHRAQLPGALVIEQPDRVAAARLAAERGARVVVLDDAYQLVDVDRDIDIAVLSAESMRAVRWLLPAGPWRERLRALRRADQVIITRRCVDRATADAVVQEVARAAPSAAVAAAHLAIAGFRLMRCGCRLSPRTIVGRRLIVATAIGDPDSFADQCRALGGEVQLLSWRDHHPFSKNDVGRILQTAHSADYVVCTEKDAVKLRSLWPEWAGEPLVAQLEVRWENGLAELERRLQELPTGTGRTGYVIGDDI